MTGKLSDTPATLADKPTRDIQPSAREGRRQVVVDVLATAIVDLLLKNRLRVRGEHEATTC